MLCKTVAFCAVVHIFITDIQTLSHLNLYLIKHNLKMLCRKVMDPTASVSTIGQISKVRWWNSVMTASPFMKVSSAAAFTLAMSWRATGPSMSTPVIEAVSISCFLANIASSATGVPCVPPLAPSAESLIFRVQIMKIIESFLGLNCQ